jgi:hypothetical protein
MGVADRTVAAFGFHAAVTVKRTKEGFVSPDDLTPSTHRGRSLPVASPHECDVHKSSGLVPTPIVQWSWRVEKTLLARGVQVHRLSVGATGAACDAGFHTFLVTAAD